MKKIIVLLFASSMSMFAGFLGEGLDTRLTVNVGHHYEVAKKLHGANVGATLSLRHNIFKDDNNNIYIGGVIDNSYSILPKVTTRLDVSVNTLLGFEQIYPKDVFTYQEFSLGLGYSYLNNATGEGETKDHAALAQISTELGVKYQRYSFGVKFKPAYYFDETFRGFGLNTTLAVGFEF